MKCGNTTICSTALICGSGYKDGEIKEKILFYLVNVKGLLFQEKTTKRSESNASRIRKN